MFLDPPYAEDERTNDLYATDGNISAEVRAWAIAWGDDPRMRIALCGYDTEHEMPSTWTAVRWKAHGGYGLQGEGPGRINSEREMIWFSPHCLPASQASLFSEPSDDTSNDETLGV